MIAAQQDVPFLPSSAPVASMVSAQDGPPVMLPFKGDFLSR